MQAAWPHGCCLPACPPAAPALLDASSLASRLLPACRPCSRKRANPLAGANQVGIGHQFLCTPCCAVPCCAAQLCCVAYHGAPPYAALLWKDPTEQTDASRSAARGRRRLEWLQTLKRRLRRTDQFINRHIISPICCSSTRSTRRSGDHLAGSRMAGCLLYARSERAVSIAH